MNINSRNEFLQAIQKYSLEDAQLSAIRVSARTLPFAVTARAMRDDSSTTKLLQILTFRAFLNCLLVSSGTAQPTELPNLRTSRQQLSRARSRHPDRSLHRVALIADKSLLALASDEDKNPYVKPTDSVATSVNFLVKETIFFKPHTGRSHLYGLAVDELEQQQSLIRNASTPLWPQRAAIPECKITWEVFSKNHETDSIWSFWREWYQGFLDGNPLDWELQRRVALIPDEDWEKGPEHIAKKIEEIKAAWLAEKAPLAEKIEFNAQTQKFHTVPLDIAKPDLLGATLSQIEDTLEDVLASPSNGLHEQSREVRVLNRVFTKYGNNPQQIEMGLVSAHKGITRQFLNDEMPQSEENLALRDALEEGARGIRATHPDVAENRKILNDQALQEMSQEDLELLEDAKPLLIAMSEGQLADDWETDIPQLINDATLPLPSGAPPLPGADEATRIFSRAAKIKMSYDRLVSKGAEAFDSKTVKTVRLGLTFGGILSALIGMGLRLFGLI